MAEPVPTPSAAGRAARSGWSWFGIAILFLSFWFFLLAAQESCYKGAHRVGATVIEKGQKADSSGAGRGSTRTSSDYWVRYRFTTPEGAAKEHVDSEVLPDTWRELEKDGPVEIEYMPSLADSRVAGQKASSGTYLAIGVVLLVAGVTLRRRAP